MNKELIIPGDEKQTITFCVEHIVSAYEKAVAEKGYFTVALSGGSTPKAIFSLLTRSPYRERLNPKQLKLYWSDERTVGQTDPDSNYKMAMDAGFASLGIPLENIHRIRGENDPVKEAADYETLVKKVQDEGGFDYLMLGMGEDGHTASLFPGTDALSERTRLVVANPVPQKNTIRITLTYPCINKAKNIVIYVLGEKKQSMLQEIFSHQTPCYPVENVGTPSNKALWIADKAAAELVPMKDRQGLK